MQSEGAPAATQRPARTPGEELPNLLKLTKDCAATERAVSRLAELSWVGLAAGPHVCAAWEGPSITTGFWWDLQAQPDLLLQTHNHVKWGFKS